jgi:multimeric flavodoxin WrbA
MFEAVVAGATSPEIEGMEVVRRAALAVTPTDMLEADGYLLGSPANLGYMSGALKHNLSTYRAIRPARPCTERTAACRAC